MTCRHWLITLINKTPFFLLWLPEKKDVWCSHEARGAPTALIWRPHWATERFRETPEDGYVVPDHKYPYSCYLQLDWLHGADLTKGVSHMWLVTKFHFSSRHRHEDLQLLWFHKILRPTFIGDCLFHIYMYWWSPYRELLCLQITATKDRQLISFKHIIKLCLPQNRQAALSKKFFLLLREKEYLHNDR